MCVCDVCVVCMCVCMCVCVCVCVCVLGVIVRRQRAREYIWKNQDDWGFYLSSGLVERKGRPKKGFDVGLPAELSDQAQNGGWRMPGTVRRLKIRNKKK